MRIATLFSGIGSPEQGAKRVYGDFKTVFACEWDKFARQSYEANYDVDKFYIISYDECATPLDTYGVTADRDGWTVDQNIVVTDVTADSKLYTADADITVDLYGDPSMTPLTADVTAESTNTFIGGDTSSSLRLGYLTGDGLAPNGWPVTPGTSFPVNPEAGEHVLRLDYKPNRLFRYDGSTWIKIEDDVRTDIYLDGETQRSSFVNNTDTISTTDRGDIPSRQSLSDLLRPDADN